MNLHGFLKKRHQDKTTKRQQGRGTKRQTTERQKDKQKTCKVKNHLKSTTLRY